MARSEEFSNFIQVTRLIVFKVIKTLIIVVVVVVVVVVKINVVVIPVQV